MRKNLARIGAATTSVSFYLTLVGNAFAQSASDSASKGGTSGALPDAGTTQLTYLLFLGGLVLFVVGTLKVILSFRD